MRIGIVLTYGSARRRRKVLYARAAERDHPTTRRTRSYCCIEIEPGSAPMARRFGNVGRIGRRTVERSRRGSWRVQPSVPAVLHLQPREPSPIGALGITGFMIERMESAETHMEAGSTPREPTSCNLPREPRWYDARAGCEIRGTRCMREFAHLRAQSRVLAGRWPRALSSSTGPPHR